MKTINILSIGNSFSKNAQKYLHDLARSEGVHIECVNLVIGGCSLATHFQNMSGDKREYILEIDGHTAVGFKTSIKEALTAREWDYVTLQQASHFSYREDSYYPYISKLADYVRTFCPKAKILLHQTWGYLSESERIIAHGFQNYEEMFSAIKPCYDKAKNEINADGILPSGTALLYALQHGVEKVHSDYLHANAGVGCFILALVWYGYLTGNDISDVKYHDFELEVTEDEYKVSLKAAMFALNQQNFLEGENSEKNN